MRLDLSPYLVWGVGGICRAVQQLFMRHRYCCQRHCSSGSKSSCVCWSHLGWSQQPPGSLHAFAATLAASTAPLHPVQPRCRWTSNKTVRVITKRSSPLARPLARVPRMVQPRASLVRPLARSSGWVAQDLMMMILGLKLPQFIAFHTYQSSCRATRRCASCVLREPMPHRRY